MAAMSSVQPRHQGGQLCFGQVHGQHAAGPRRLEQLAAQDDDGKRIRQ